MATTGSLPGGAGRDILMDLRSLRTHFEALNTPSWMEKKVEVMKQSVDKVETAVYEMTIRGRERPKGWVPDLADDRAPVESY